MRWSVASSTISDVREQVRQIGDCYVEMNLAKRPHGAEERAPVRRFLKTTGRSNDHRMADANGRNWPIG